MKCRKLRLLEFLSFVFQGSLKILLTKEMNSNFVLKHIWSKKAFIPSIANCFGEVSNLSIVSIGLVIDKETSSKITVGIL